MAASNSPDFTPEQREQIDRLTQEALERPPEARDAFVRAAAGADEAVAREVLELLAGLDEPGASAYLADPAALPTTLAAEEVTRASGGGTAGGRASEKAGDVIGAYTLRQQLGEGGFGVVWLAEQSQPVRRQVALKVIKLGMDTQQVIRRFEAERQALALMDHPSISKVFEAGATENGRPYFAMEYVDGLPITEYCDQRRLSLAARLELFIEVCQAVQHAHQKGIIHRDIKPGNVLVTEVDGRAVPKVIDFGIAKATDQRLTEQTLFTELGQFIGTPAYMSPEQADATTQDIDTRSDLYSLGVVLYELLTGRTPFDLRTLRGAALDEIKRIIREVEPSRPSARLSEPSEQRSVAAARRRVGDRRLGTVLRGDLDWIVMKALEKDRRRRYASATGLAEDVRRHLNNEPVEASPPSAMYRLSRLVRRNRLVFGAGAAIVVLLIAGVAGTSVGLVRALRAEERARAEAEVARIESVRSATTARLLRDALAGVGPSVARGRDTLLLEEILDRTESRIAAELIDESEVEASMRSTLAVTYTELGLFEKAQRNAERALELYRQLRDGPHGDTAMALNVLGLVHENRGRFEEAEALYRDALATWEELRDPGDDDLEAEAVRNLATLLRTTGRYDEARALLDRALAMLREFHGGADHQDTATVINAFGNLERELGAFEAARDFYEEALAIHRRVLEAKHPFIATDLHNLGGLLEEMGEVERSEAVLREALALRREVLGEHPDTAETLFQLGVLLQYAGRSEEAETVQREAVEMARRALRPDHPRLAAHLSQLGLILGRRGDREAALALHREALQIDLLHAAVDPEAAAASRNDIAYCLMELGRLDEAEQMFGLALVTFEELHPDGSPEVATLLNNIGRCQRKQERYAEAAATFERTLEVRRALYGTAHPQIANTINDLGTVRAEQGRLDEAESLKRQAVAMYVDLLGEDHIYTVVSRVSLGGVLLKRDALDEAITIFEASLEAYLATFGAPHTRTLALRREYGDALLARERIAAAEEQFRRVLADAAAGDGFEVGPIRVRLGRVLVRGARFAEAESLLLVAAEEGDAASRREARAELVRMYEAWHAADPAGDHDASAERWRGPADGAD